MLLSAEEKLIALKVSKIWFLNSACLQLKNECRFSIDK